MVAAVVVLDEWWTGSAREARTEATRKAYVPLVDVFALPSTSEQCSPLLWGALLSSIFLPVFSYTLFSCFAPFFIWPPLPIIRFFFLQTSEHDDNCFHRFVFFPFLVSAASSLYLIFLSGPFLPVY
jgi:hypothetical protein